MVDIDAADCDRAGQLGVGETDVDDALCRVGIRRERVGKADRFQRGLIVGLAAIAAQRDGDLAVRGADRVRNVRRQRADGQHVARLGVGEHHRRADDRIDVHRVADTHVAVDHRGRGTVRGIGEMRVVARRAAIALRAVVRVEVEPWNADIDGGGIFERRVAVLVELRLRRRGVAGQPVVEHERGHVCVVERRVGLCVLGLGRVAILILGAGRGDLRQRGGEVDVRAGLAGIIGKIVGRRADAFARRRGAGRIGRVADAIDVADGELDVGGGVGVGAVEHEFPLDRYRRVGAIVGEVAQQEGRVVGLLAGATGCVEAHRVAGAQREHGRLEVERLALIGGGIRPDRGRARRGQVG